MTSNGSDEKVILANGRLHSIVTGKISIIFIFGIYRKIYIARNHPLYIACYQIETVKDGNPNYFRINFDSIEQYPATRQPETKGLPIKDGWDGRLHKTAMKCKRVVTKRHAKTRFPFWFYDAARRYATTKDLCIKFAAVFGSGKIVKDLPRLEFHHSNFRGKLDRVRENGRVYSVTSVLRRRNRLRRSTLNRELPDKAITIVYEKRILRGLC